MRKLHVIWAGLDIMLLGAGVLCIAASIMFTQPEHLILNLVVSRFDFIIGLTIGGMYILASLFSIPAILQPVARSTMLKLLNWWLIICSLVTLALGTAVWIFSLRQISAFSAIWEKQTPGIQQAIQDTYKCCGYTNGTMGGQFMTSQGFCADANFAAVQSGCVSIITSATSPGSDFTLESIFSTIYGFEAILVFFFLATVCIINERQIQVRFARIDEKRGGGGFV